MINIFEEKIINCFQFKMPKNGSFPPKNRKMHLSMLILIFVLYLKKSNDDVNILIKFFLQKKY